MNFEEYLTKQGLKPDTISQHQRYILYFICWLSDNGIFMSEVSYTTVLDFTDTLREEGRTPSQVNRVLLALRYYFGFLMQEEGRPGPNPAAGIRVKGAVRTVPHDLLTKEELEVLYHSYEVKDTRTHRNKVILSLLVFQGLTNEELHKLQAHHIKLKEGKIYIPSGSQTNSRTLKLQAEQIMELYEYIHVTRPKILQERTAERSGRKPNTIKEAETIHQLFISMNGCENMKNSLLHLNYALKRINPNYRNALQIRQSVITEWLKEKDVRTVQYMAGHRYVSSTERYQTSSLEDLKEALNKHHPLK